MLAATFVDSDVTVNDKMSSPGALQNRSFVILSLNLVILSGFSDAQTRNKLVSKLILAQIFAQSL